MKNMQRVILITLLLLINPIFAEKPFAENYCHDPDYICVKIKSHDSWSNLFPNPEIRDMIRRINRMNTGLKPGLTIAIPKNIDRLTIYDVSPFPRYIEPTGEKTIYVSQSKLAWAAYDTEGELVWWGPISSGMSRCPGVIGGCKTPTGSFRIVRKQDIECISTAFPRRADGNNGGAEMPYCMHFFMGFALHGSDIVPGYPASHGCVRLFTEDARWLNEDFVETAEEGSAGTRVVIDEPSA